MIEIEIGKYVEKAVNFLSSKCSPFFNSIKAIVGGIVGFLQQIFNYPHPLVMIIIITTFVYWIKSRKKGTFTKKGFKNAIGFTIFTFLGLFLLKSMGFWSETMNTLALILSSSLLALIIGVPLGIWASRNNTFASAIKPVLDFMQTMPAFVYLIPAILLFNVGNVP